jgi:23S rRNA pseudouridine1911/1915/1917 synthase
LKTKDHFPILDIIHENKDYIVVNKTAGRISELSSYEPITTESLTLAHLLKSKPKPFIGVIHRLDRVTSGVLIFAKNKSNLVAFNRLFYNRKVQKTYLAIVKNKPPKNSGVLINYLKKNNAEKKAEVQLSQSNEAKESILSYKLIDQNDFGYLLEVKPKSGRFHQIRVQLAHIGSPILGDVKYGADDEYKRLSICLHACKITFPTSLGDSKITYSAPLPQDKFWKFESL